MMRAIKGDEVWTMLNGAKFFEQLVINVVKLPGVKVDRTEFLAKSFSKHVTARQLADILEKGPVQSNVSKKLIRRVAKKNILNRTMKSSSASFAAGLPGGVVMAATVPADTAQFFGVALRVAQEIGYIYGYEDFWSENGLDVNRVSGELILFLGVMFGVSGATATIKVLSSQLSKQALKKIPNRAMMQTIYYPILKKMGSYIGLKMTRKSFAQGISKVIPIAGGVISGWITYSSMHQMGNRLLTALEESMDLSDEELVASIKEMKQEIPNMTEKDFGILQASV